MGCDIHLRVEKRIAGEWCPIGDEDTYFFGKNYTLFSILAGVRGFEDPIAEPKGLPKDMSKEVAAYFDDRDFHSFSWLSLKELDSYPWRRKRIRDSVGTFRDRVLPDLRALGSPEDVRIVFAFDS